MKKRKQFVHQMIARCVCSTKAAAVLWGSKQLSARSLDTFREHVQIQSAYPERWDSYKFFQELHWQNSTSSLQTGLKQNTVDHLHKPSVPYVAYVWLMDAGTQQHKTETHNKQKTIPKNHGYADLQMMRKWCGWCVVLATMDGHDLGRWNRPFAKSGMPRSCMICIQIESESYLFCLLPAAVQGVSAILTPNGARRHRGCSVELLLKTLKRELLKWRCWLGHASWMIVSCHRLLRQLNCFGSSPDWHFKESF